MSDMEEPPDRSWLNEFPPRTQPVRQSKPNPDFDELETIETPEAFSSRWSKRLALGTMIVLTSGAALVFIGVVIRIFKWVAGL